MWAIVLVVIGIHVGLVLTLVSSSWCQICKRNATAASDDVRSYPKRRAFSVYLKLFGDRDHRWRKRSPKNKKNVCKRWIKTLTVISAEQINLNAYPHIIDPQATKKVESKSNPLQLSLSLIKCNTEISLLACTERNFQRFLFKKRTENKKKR